MDKCEAHKIKKAFDIEYSGNMDITICEMNACPYNNDGGLIKCMDGLSRMVCQTDGDVEIADKFVNIEGTLIPKSNSLGCMIGL